MPCRATVDPDLCIGTSQCAEVAPNGYRMNADHTLPVPKPDASREALLEGAMSCPVGALTVHDEQGEQIWPKP